MAAYDLKARLAESHHFHARKLERLRAMFRQNNVDYMKGVGLAALLGFEIGVLEISQDISTSGWVGVGVAVGGMAWAAVDRHRESKRLNRLWDKRENACVAVAALERYFRDVVQAKEHGDSQIAKNMEGFSYRLSVVASRFVGKAKGAATALTTLAASTGIDRKALPEADDRRGWQRVNGLMFGIDARSKQPLLHVHDVVGAVGQQMVDDLQGVRRVLGEGEAVTDLEPVKAEALKVWDSLYSDWGIDTRA